MSHDDPHQEYFTITAIKLRLINLLSRLLGDDLLGPGQDPRHDLLEYFPSEHLLMGVPGDALPCPLPGPCPWGRKPGDRFSYPCRQYITCQQNPIFSTLRRVSPGVIEDELRRKVVQ